MSAERESSFLELLSVHARLLEQFLQHQAALVERDFGRALERLLAVRRDFEEHARAEEELFRRLFAQTEEVNGTPIELFLGEHRRLRDFLTEFETAARRLGASAPARDVVDLLEEEALFKAFFRHHDERERTLLYPAFDRDVPASTRRELLRKFSEHLGASAPPAGAS